MLNTNRLGPPSSDQMTNIPKVDDLINKLDTGQFLPDHVIFCFHFNKTWDHELFQHSLNQNSL